MKTNKTLLRKHFTQLRNSIPTEIKSEWDNILCQKLIDICKDANVIHTYLPYRSEPNLLPFISTILDQKKQVICPKTLKGGIMGNRILKDVDDISYGMYNTPYPSNDQIYNGNYDVIIIPGMAFDLKGYRLGYGGGYYDRFLQNLSKPKLIAPCYPFQYVDNLPIEKYDIPIDDVILSL